MPSDRFERLKAQLQVLRTHLLPATFEATGLYDDQDKVATMALAYRVLAHAEIEAYFEDRVLEAADRAHEAWEREAHVSRVLLCLMSFSGEKAEAPPATLQPPGANGSKAWPALVDIRLRIKAVVSAFNYLVRKGNHGIKEKNLMALLLPIGVVHDKIDPVFLAEIDSFGSLRGVAAHSSSGTAVRTAIDPAEELRRTEALLPHIEALDAQVDSIVSAIPTPKPKDR